MTSIILTSLLIMLASLVGVIFTWKALGGFIQKRVSLMVSFSAGVFLLLVLSLSQEVFHGDLSTMVIIGWFLTGIIGVLLLFRFLPMFHHHHTNEHDDHAHGKLDARKIVISDAIHNAGDGILLASAFAFSFELGLATALGIFIHEIIQEVSEFFVLKQAGLSTKKALVVNFIASSPVLIFGLASYWLLESFVVLETPLLALSAGAFLVVVVFDLIPESVRRSREEKNYTKHGIVFVVGLLLMLWVGSVFGHSHGEGDGHDYYDHGHGYTHEEEHDDHDEDHDGNHDEEHNDDKHGYNHEDEEYHDNEKSDTLNL